MDSLKSLDECRQDFPSLQRLCNGKPPIYMDNACTTLVPKQVIESIREYYTQYPAVAAAAAATGSRGKLPAASKAIRIMGLRVLAGR